MKQIKQAVQLIILFILAVSCSNILGPSDNNQSNIYGVSQGHAAGINYLGDVSKVFSAPSNGRY
ncbi:hypothetical protein E4O05_00555 [Treponema sp. OMZ 787]|uniref:hypothetical protein n=1 Tax=Treponema sp. OMZ 787 TaxID=2563669 RepID=UPI0020A4D360|nr:hypothetical protein [Treponema sp. OMZ 787]UTC62442.1 hypothetical protein E4O05_00555 [Treponema sp. OMZ 787]